MDGDSESEIITSAAWNGGPHVRIFDNMGNAKYPGFFAFEKTFSGGANVTCGDIDGDGNNDIVVGAGAGGGPHVIVFTPTGEVIAETFVDAATTNGGAYVALSDVDRDGKDEILTSSMGYSSPTVKRWSYNTKEDHLELVDTVTSSTPATLISPLANTRAYLVGGNRQPEIQFTDENGTITKTFSPFTSGETHTISAAPIVEKGTTQGFVVGAISSKINDDFAPKSIRVSIAQQRLTAYEYGVPVKTFLISTAKKGYVTPLGKTDVKEKLLYHTYKWTFGVGDPRNYNVPNVKYNLRIYKHIYIHWAYWHNNFGNPMSHGCVNANEENSKWIYEWSDVGTSVNIVT